MDVLAHALYGATLCSRTGLAGGRQGTRRSFSYDWTVWVAAGFGLLPDMASIGAAFFMMMIRGEAPDFHALPPHVFVLYHSTHSLVFAGFLLLVLRLMARPLVIPALAWPLHIVMDSFFHATGWWQTMMFYPLSDWHYNGINWWQHPLMMLLYWGILPVLWIAIALWRRCRPSGGEKSL